MATGEIVTLYENKDKTIAAYPRTVSEAVKHVEDDGTVRSVSEVINDLKNSVSDGKELLATAITNKKVATEPTDSFATMASNIDSLKLGSGNATTADVLSGKTFTNSDGIEYMGTMPNKGSRENATTVFNAEGNLYLFFPEGYYDNSPAIRTPLSNLGDASQSEVLSGKTFTSTAGLKVSGTYVPPTPTYLITFQTYVLYGHSNGARPSYSYNTVYRFYTSDGSFVKVSGGASSSTYYDSDHGGLTSNSTTTIVSIVKE